MIKEIVLSAALAAGIVSSADNKAVNKVNIKEKLVALTFDDGPNPKVLGEMLALFKKENVSATFYMNGKHIKKYKELTRSVLDQGHEIGNHTMTHPSLPELTRENC